MSSTTVERPTKIGVTNKKENVNNTKAKRISNAIHKKHKHEENRHFKFGRKRLQSFTSNGKFFPPYKRRKKEGGIIPPTKFLLGGNICDPLNLNSMQDEEVNRAMNAVTPKSSPLPTPKHRKEAIEVIIPPNICDPLNLINCNDDDEYEKQLISPVKKNNKKRNRKRKKASSPGKDDISEATEIKDSIPIEEAKVEESIVNKILIEPQKPSSPLKSPPQEPQQSKVDLQAKDKVKLRLKGLEEPKDKRLRKLDVKDKIVSPVIPQPGAWKPRLQHRPNQDKKKKAQLPNFNSKNVRYQFGNYNRYYGYRNLHHNVDPRLTVFAQRKELFFGKDILDIGCNIGHITLSIARDFTARSVTGIDIDKKLINVARKNVKHYVNCVQSPVSTEDGDHREYDTNYFPISMLINYGPVDIPGFTKHNDHKGFPYNVTFVQGNYVLEDDALLSSEQPQFDIILCLSITKWIHLNFGDAGLKQSFKRMHAQLRPGGVLILEPQNWSSYSKKKSLTEKIYKNYQSIEFLPHKFTQYLLSSEVGFCKCEVVSVPPHPSKGFQRPIYLYTKADVASPAPATAVTPRTTAASVEGTPTEDVTPMETVSVSRNERRHSREQQEYDRREYERELFPMKLLKEPWEGGNQSSTSQRSGESLSQYEHLENVYAPSATPCYDTPVHNVEAAPDPEDMCYLDVKIEHDQCPDRSSDEERKPPSDGRQQRPEGTRDGNT
ncbi:PREDICTED: probable RNA methyltransferase bin3 [Ceratosolen solmsi marchali]|uniref:RNA methyltransferase n=1 Tax=Ceratosolen solmsi marchali TaxID=326594 RepID=A0AAJ6YEP6_9HYME|nr:PREDICTED: probable RNA methyltransferase bin3 [Ceratosolen solmsi marchali]XP_011496692.1 PREDICTED: probable RNA methyltransferase bin3 [Ceratosolen solmsi marchali]